MRALKQFHLLFYTFSVVITRTYESERSREIYIILACGDFQLCESFLVMRDEITPVIRNIVFMNFVKLSHERAHLYKKKSRYLGEHTSQHDILQRIKNIFVRARGIRKQYLESLWNLADYKYCEI